MRFRDLQAQDGCIIFFPFRQPSKRMPTVVSGPQRTRRRFGEEWVQLRTDLVTLEVRLEGDQAVNLGSDLRCDVVARTIAHIDEADLQESLPKLVTHLRCATTADRNAILTATFFRERLMPKFRAAIEHVVMEANYLLLLDDMEHHTSLQGMFRTQAEQLLNECGFSLVAGEIRFRPRDPGIVAAEQAVTERWIEQERARVKLEARKQRMVEESEDENKREAAERAATREMELKSIDIRKRMNEQLYEDQVHGIDLERANQDHAHKRALAEARRELDDYFREHQRLKDEEEQQQRIQEIKDREALAELEQLEAHRHEAARLEHDRTLLRERTQLLKVEHELAKAEVELARLRAEEKKLNGQSAAEVVESRVRAENAFEGDRLRGVVETFGALIEKLPDIAASLPRDGNSDRTVIQIGRDLSGEGADLSAHLPVVLTQIVESFVSLFRGGSGLSGPSKEEVSTEPSQQLRVGEEP